MKEKQNNKKDRIDIHSTQSKKKGLSGLLERFFRSFKTLGFALMLSPLFVLYLCAIGLALSPAVYLFSAVYPRIEGINFFLKGFVLATSLGFGYFLYGFTLIFVVPLFNLLVIKQVKPFKGNWFSMETIPWFIHNALTYLVRYTFLEFLTPTPLNILFYKMMGMKIGKHVVINTTNISDPCLIELEDYVTIGGSAHVMAHYGQKGILVVSRTLIKRGATIGLKASVFGDVIIGQKVLVPPHMVVFPKTRLEDHYRFDKKAETDQTRIL